MIGRENDCEPSPPAPVDPGYPFIPDHPSSRFGGSFAQREGGVSRALPLPLRHLMGNP